MARYAVCSVTAEKNIHLSLNCKKYINNSLFYIYRSLKGKFTQKWKLTVSLQKHQNPKMLFFKVLN